MLKNIKDCFFFLQLNYGDDKTVDPMEPVTQCLHMWLEDRPYEIGNFLEPAIKRYATKTDVSKLHNLCLIGLLSCLHELDDGSEDGLDMLRLHMFANWSHRCDQDDRVSLGKSRWFFAGSRRLAIYR